MLGDIKVLWLRLSSWKAKKWKDFNKLISSREVQENLKRIDTDEEGCYWGMGEVPPRSDSQSQVSRHKL